jgi:hypothetical protein
MTSSVAVRFRVRVEACTYCRIKIRILILRARTDRSKHTVHKLKRSIGHGPGPPHRDRIGARDRRSGTVLKTVKSLVTRASQQEGAVR